MRASAAASTGPAAPAERPAPRRLAARCPRTVGAKLRSGGDEGVAADWSAGARVRGQVVVPMDLVDEVRARRPRFQVLQSRTQGALVGIARQSAGPTGSGGWRWSSGERGRGEMLRCPGMFSARALESR